MSKPRKKSDQFRNWVDHLKTMNHLQLCNEFSLPVPIYKKLLTEFGFEYRNDYDMPDFEVNKILQRLILLRNKSNTKSGFGSGKLAKSYKSKISLKALKKVKAPQVMSLHTSRDFVIKTAKL